MKKQYIIACVLIAVGVAIFSYHHIHYTTQERAVDLGPISVVETKTHDIPLSSILGVVCLAGGLILLVIPQK